VATPPKEKPRLPWTGEFSPGQLGEDALAETLAIVEANSGEYEQIVESVRLRWFAQKAEKRTDPLERLRQQRTRAGNVLIGMKSYGLVSDVNQLTDFGISLHNETDSRRRSEEFARFLLKHKRGLELVDVVRTLRQRGVTVTNQAVRDELRSRGYFVTVNDGAPGKLRQWLATSEVFGNDWTINEGRIAEITGTSVETIGDWQSLTKVERAFLVTIRRLSETRGKTPIPSPELLDFVRQEHGPIFNEGQVKKVYQALRDGSWITHKVKPSGRGGKGGEICASDKLIDVDFELLVGFKPGDLPADTRAALTRPLDAVYTDLKSNDTHVKGIALEVLAAKLASDLGLIPLRLRVRGVRTGGAEVDLLAEGTHLHFNRWLFQCKNTRTVDVGVLAKEVGMATLLQAHVIVIATTGRFSQTVVTYAERVCETTPFQVVLLSAKILEAYRKDGALALRESLRESAQETMRRKRPQVVETLDELAEDES
jgi:Restriction endonuclease